MNALQRFAGGAATAFAVLALAAPAYADGMRGSIKDKKPEPRRCTLAANVALTSDYIFRGVSQSSETPAIQGGFDATCGIFYAGVWASSIDFGAFPVAGPDPNIASIEVDLYAGIKPVTGRITWDLGVIYYAYPRAFDPGVELDMVEVKVGGSGEIWKGGTLGVTVFYSPEYTFEQGKVWTVETAFAQALPPLGRFSPTFSALLGYQKGDTSDGYFTANTDDSYLYWNAGVAFVFDTKFSLDIRYWDTDISDAGGFCSGSLFGCDERIVATLKFTY